MFNEKLKNYRTSLNLTQEEFAEKTGITRALIGMIESGKRPPSQNVIMKLSEFSNKSIDWWYGKEDKTKTWTELNDLSNLLDFLIDKNLIKENGDRDAETESYIQKMLNAEIKKKLSKKYSVKEVK